MNNCKYCAQEQKLDDFGYCEKDKCFERSGENNHLNIFIRRASNLILIPRYETNNISGIVTNYYRVRTREANNIINDAKQRWGFVPSIILSAIPKENQEPWDKNIRW